MCHAPGTRFAPPGGGSGTNGSCSGLQEQLYAASMQAAECPLNSTKPTCDMPVDLSIDGCGYWVYVDASNVKALNDLSTAKEQWKELDCGPIAACALGGYPAKPAHCAAEGQGGTTGFCTPD